MNQIEIDFQAGLTKQYSSLIEVCRAVAYGSSRKQADIARDMDLAPTILSRRLADNPNDTQALKVKDLEPLIESTEERGKDVIYYLIEKYLEDPQTRRDRALDMLGQMMPAIQAVMQELGGAQKSTDKDQNKAPNLHPVA